MARIYGIDIGSRTYQILGYIKSIADYGYMQSAIALKIGSVQQVLVAQDILDQLRSRT